MSMDNSQKIPKRILSTLMNAVSAGVVPRTGAPYLAIGRTEEIAALAGDLDSVSEGASTIRFLIGKYGSGKSFLIQLIRSSAMERNFVCADADLSPERRISGGNGAGLATYRELIKNLSTKSVPDGGALPFILTRWLSSLQSEAASSGLSPETEAFAEFVREHIFSVANDVSGEVCGFDFARVLHVYYQAYLDGDDEKKNCCLRWFRGEYSTKTEARADLSVGAIITDETWYEFCKLWAVFFRRIGYAGLLIAVDECVNLYKISNRVAREKNYEKLLTMFNDVLQGKAEGICLLFGGTPQFLEDTRRGLYSYEALHSRLAEGQFNGISADNRTVYKNLIGPVIRLRRLSKDELFALVTRVTRLHSMQYDWTPPVSREEMVEFLDICLSRIGADSMITPREIIRDYCTILNILLQNPGTQFVQVLNGGAVRLESRPNSAEAEEESPVPKTVSPENSLFEEIEL